MNPTDDDLPGSGEATPREYRYRYKYLHKYADQNDAPHGDDGRDNGRDNDSGDHPRGDDTGGDRDGDDAKKSGSGKQEGKNEEKKDDEGKDDKDKKEGGDEKSPEQKRKQKRKRILVLSIIAGVFVLAAVAWLLLYIFVLSQRETTDDAYVRGDMVTISPRVAGTVVEITVEETDRVYAGQVLMRLDPADGQADLMNAEGQLAQAVRQAQQSIQQAAEADAAVVQRRAQYESQREDYARRHPLLAQRAIAKEEVDNAYRQTQAAYAALQQAQAQAAAAHAQVDGTTVYDFPSVIQARAKLRNAWVNNTRNAIVSPIDGYAARRQVQVGQRVQPGQDLLTVVPLADLWVDANFKETQLEHIRIGQPVELTTDMYSDLTYHGKVIGLDAGTGSAFSLLPAENATGNWIKVVQRLPVRIALDPRQLREHPLRIGLSTDVKVDTHDRNGDVLVSGTREKPLASTAVYEREVIAADRRAEQIIQANTVSPPMAGGRAGKAGRGP